MGAHVGLDCQVALGGTGYWIEPGSYRVQRPRRRRITLTAGGAQRYVDAGPGKRVWWFVVLAYDGLSRYDGQPTGLSGQDYRDALAASYAAPGPLAFVDPGGIGWSVYMDDLVESMPDLRTQVSGPAYRLAVVLVEA